MKSQDHFHIKLDTYNRQGVCPACHGKSWKLIGHIGYDSTLKKWNIGVNDAKILLGFDPSAVHLEWNECSSCSFQWTPTSIEGLVEYVETHPAMGSKIAYEWFFMQHPIIDEKWIEHITQAPNLNCYEKRHHHTLTLINSLLGKSKRFLDLGSCYGTTAAMINLVHKDVEVLMCETSPTFSKVAQERYPQITMLNRQIDERDKDSFDFIYCSDVIEHVWDIDHFAMSLAGALSHNGLALIITPNLSCESANKQGLDWWGILPPHHCQVFTSISLKTLLHRHGLETVDEGTLGEDIYVVTTRQRKGRTS